MGFIIPAGGIGGARRRSNRKKTSARADGYLPGETYESRQDRMQNHGGVFQGYLPHENYEGRQKRLNPQQFGDDS